MLDCFLHLRRAMSSYADGDQDAEMLIVGVAFIAIGFVLL